MKLINGSLKGLNHLHEQKLLHRDIKPNNILVSNNLEAKISDFGIAKDLKNDWKTTINTTSGTFGYIPIEVHQSLRHSFKSDIFSLGCVFYQLMSGGHHPFGANSFD